MSTPGFAIFILLARVSVLQLVAARRSTGYDINGNYFQDFFRFVSSSPHFLIDGELR